MIRFENNNKRSEVYDKQRDIPRPGHADFTANAKFKGFEDYRGGGHFSSWLTVEVAAGVIAKKVLNTRLTKDIIFQTDIIEVGGFRILKKVLNSLYTLKTPSAESSNAVFPDTCRYRRTIL
jgi:chorismate synthase